MRSVLALVASGLVGLAAVISSMDYDADLAGFFVGLSVLGAIEAWSVRPPYQGLRRSVAIGVASVWILAATYVTTLLVLSVTVMQAASPPPQPEATYLGLTATAYRAVGLYGGLVLVVVSAVGPARWFQGRRGIASEPG